MKPSWTGSFFFARKLADARTPAPEVKRRLEKRQRQVEEGITSALSLLLDLGRLDTGPHTTRLAAWAVLVAKRMALPETELRAIETASVLRDIGKIGVPNEILMKPGRLTDEDYAAAKQHSEYGWSILRSIPGFERVSVLVLHHHERWDGLGYPSGLEGDEIPLGARIVALVDTLDAMLSDRPYRKGMPLELVLEKLSPEGGHQFDPEVLSHFLELASRRAADIAQVAETAAPLVSSGPSPHTTQAGPRIDPLLQRPALKEFWQPGISESSRRHPIRSRGTNAENEAR